MNKMGEKKMVGCEVWVAKSTQNEENIHAK